MFRIKEQFSAERKKAIEDIAELQVQRAELQVF
jgi:hypothetical protein